MLGQNGDSNQIENGHVHNRSRFTTGFIVNSVPEEFYVTIKLIAVVLQWRRIHVVWNLLGTWMSRYSLGEKWCKWQRHGEFGFRENANSGQDLSICISTESVKKECSIERKRGLTCERASPKHIHRFGHTSGL